jgi:cobalamin biosynthesis Mg chelatase CobN
VTTPASPSDTTPNGRHPTSSTPTDAKDPDAIRADIERTRDDLAETVDALHAKLDVKAQAKAKVADLKTSVTTDSGKPSPALVVGVLGVTALVVGLVWWRRR